VQSTATALSVSVVSAGSEYMRVRKVTCDLCCLVWDDNRTFVYILLQAYVWRTVLAPQWMLRSS